jgi:hypothetical protein
MAAQQGLGLLPEWRTRIGGGNIGCPAFVGQNLRSRVYVKKP